jgi:hypothetical protein
MAWTFNGVGSEANLPSGPYLDVPDGDWTFSGWFRLAGNSHNTFKRIASWGTRAATPHIQVYVAGDNVGGTSQRDHLGGRFKDPAGNDTGIMFVDDRALTFHLDKWMCWIFSHDGSTNTTYLQLYDPATDELFTDTSVQALGGIDNTDITDPFHIGALNTGLADDRFIGDLAETSFVPGLFAGPDAAGLGISHGARTFRLGAGWNLPMLGGRTELWCPDNAVVTPNTTNVTLTTYDGPPLRLISPQPMPLTGTAMNPLTPSLESTLNFVQVGRANQVCHLTVNDALNLTHNADSGRLLPVSADNTLTLVGTAGQTFELSANQALSITGIVNHLNIAGDRLPTGSVLNFTQLVETEGVRDVEQDLGLIQTVNVVFPIKPVVTQLLGIGHHTSTPHRAFITDDLSLFARADIPLPTQHVTSTLNFVHEAPIGNVENTLNFAQSVQFSKSLTAFSVMDLVSDMSRIMIYNRTLTHDNAIGHALTWFEDSPCGRKRYTPFQGENTIPLDVSPPSNTLADPQGEDNTFKLYQPYLGVHTSEVELRQPELDNRDRNAFSRVSQETRGGNLLVFSDPTWPKIRTLAVTIVGLTETKVNEFQTFMQSTVGQVIGLTDWEGRLWNGFITNPNEQATQDGKGRWTVTFEFEGEMLDVQQAGEEGDGGGMAMNLSHSVTAVIV